MLLKIDELVTKYSINYPKYGFGSEWERGAVATCSGDGLSLAKKSLYESEMSCGRNNCPRRVFFLSGEISGCAIDLADGVQCKCKRLFVFKAFL